VIRDPAGKRYLPATAEEDVVQSRAVIVGVDLASASRGKRQRHGFSRRYRDIAFDQLRKAKLRHCCHAVRAYSENHSSGAQRDGAP
jgi:hypothetical protein